MYIELKTGYQDNGPAWIGRVEFSQSGRTCPARNLSCLSSEASAMVGV